MKNNLPIALLAVFTLTSSTLFIPLKAVITVATYNMTHANKNNGKKREAGNCDVIKQLKADIYGFQEVIKDKNQFKSIKKTLPNYAYFGETRNSQLKRSFSKISLYSLFAQDEYCPIFYNPEKVDLIAGETFGINGDNSGYLPRICTVGKFQEKMTKKEFYVYNTHLDNKKEETRIMQVNLITDDIAQRCGTTPVIVMGDFNNAYAGTIKENLSNANFTHAKGMALKKSGPVETHEKGSTKELTCIDHILIKPKKAFSIKNYKVLNTMSEKTSDHNPVEITFSLN